jgi:hypothetical protein
MATPREWTEDHSAGAGRDPTLSLFDPSSRVSGDDQFVERHDVVAVGGKLAGEPRECHLLGHHLLEGGHVGAGLDECRELGFVADLGAYLLQVTRP